MEQPISFSALNDFIFCPVSIYFHMIDGNPDKMLAQETVQLNGSAAHEAVDTQTYSTSAHILQGVPFYSEKYDIEGVIDTFDMEKRLLTERKRTVHKVYDGFVFQLYAQYFGLTESGYRVDSMRLHSMTDNKNYPVPLPGDNPEMLQKFEDTLRRMREFVPEGFVQENGLKCEHCIYEALCSFSAAGE